MAALEAHGRTQTADPDSRLMRASDAAALALAGNPGLRAAYADLGLAHADLYAASRIANPVLSASRLTGDGSGQHTIGLAASIADVLTLGSRTRAAKDDLAAHRLELASLARSTAAAAEQGFYRLVAARHVVLLREQSAHAALLSARLAEPYYRAGNLTDRELALHQAAAADAELEAIEARMAASAARAQLAQVMGVSSAADWSVPELLDTPPADDPNPADMLMLARERRTDLAAAIARTDAAARRARLENWAPLLGDLQVGYERERDGSETHRGPGIEFGLPIALQGGARRARARAELGRRLAELEGIRQSIEGDVRLALADLGGAREKLRVYREQLVPARVRGTAGAREQQAFMLIGTFELIESKRDEYAAHQGYVEAVRDYWIARTTLALAVGDALPTPVSGIPMALPDAMRAAVRSADGHAQVRAQETTLEQPPSGERGRDAEHDHGGHDMPMPETPAQDHAHDHGAHHD